MRSIIVEQDFPYDIIRRGEHDLQRHNKRIKEATRKQLKDIISSQDIITNEGNKKIKVRLKYLDQYRFRRNVDRTDEIGRDEFDDLNPGDIIHKPKRNRASGLPCKAGDQAGEEVYEVEFTIKELTDMMIEELELPNLEDTAQAEIVSDALDWTDRRKKVGIMGAIDKKQTILANILRKSKLKDKSKKRLNFIEDDLRFKTWEIKTEKHSNAVVLLMMDKSASMWEEKIYAVKAFYFWVVQFLKHKYRTIDIRFIAHDFDARELSEKEFFSISDTGGTRVSAAYRLCLDIIKHKYSSDEWNIYCFHASDGDTWGDEVSCTKLIEEIIQEGAKLFAYTEVNIEDWREESPLLEEIKGFGKKKREVVVSIIKKNADILDALRNFLSAPSVTHAN